jgi:membrane protein required for colicin V production
MNALDIALVVVVAAFVVYGAVKGLVRLVLGSVAIASGIFLGCWYHAPVEAFLSRWIHEEHARLFVAFGSVFVLTLLAFAVLVWFITKTLEAAKLRWVDRLTGAAVGLLLAALLLGAVLVPVVAFLPTDSTLVGGSRISPYVLRISAFVKSIVPDSLKKRYEEARAKMAAAGKGILPGGGNVPMPPSVPEMVKGIESLAPAKAKAPVAKPAASDPNG